MPGIVPAANERDIEVLARAIRHLAETGFDLSILNAITSLATDDTFPFYDTSTGLNAKVTLANLVSSIPASGTICPPQGRLTLVTATPVMTSSQSAKTTLFYTPYVGELVPIYNGTSFAMTDVPEISVATTDTTKNPAAIGASKVNDWFVWDDAGTRRLTHSVDWTNDTTRASGLTLTNGIYLNTSSITNGPAALQGTFVGTTRSNASSQLDYIFGGSASGGTAAWFGLWNTYNRQLVKTQVIDTVSGFSVAGNTITVFNSGGTGSGLNNRVSYVSGLAEDFFSARNDLLVSAAGGNNGSGGIAYDSTTTISGTIIPNGALGTGACGGSFATTSLGFHYFQSMVANQGGGASSYYGNAGVATYIQAGLNADLWL